MTQPTCWSKSQVNQTSQGVFSSFVKALWSTKRLIIKNWGAKSPKDIKTLNKKGCSLILTLLILKSHITHQTISFLSWSRVNMVIFTRLVFNTLVARKSMGSMFSILIPFLPVWAWISWKQDFCSQPVRAPTMLCTNFWTSEKLKSTLFSTIPLTRKVR